MSLKVSGPPIDCPQTAVSFKTQIVDETVIVAAAANQLAYQ